MPQHEAILSKSTAPAFPRPAIRALLSVLILVHVLAVFLGPWAMPPSSDLASGLASLMKPYLQATFLDNGYRFFAPEPGPSHLVHYDLLLEDGRRLQGVFPDLREHRPRLLYHRHFMLSEFLNTTSYRPSRELLESCARSYARHLARKHHAVQVTLSVREHAPPTIYDVRDGMKLTDPSLYKEPQESRFGPYRGDDL